uniref:Uncharacterized protein n=1 Tax=Panagrolaimus davidi TaxID=227884 RepID=A0A914NZN3_9BILA
MRTLSEDFDIDTFYSFIKKNNTRISLCFSHTISEAYKNHLEAIIDEIIEAKNHAYIYFHGLEDTKNNKMWDLFNKR